MRICMCIYSNSRIERLSLSLYSTRLENDEVVMRWHFRYAERKRRKGGKNVSLLSGRVEEKGHRTPGVFSSLLLVGSLYTIFKVLPFFFSTSRRGMRPFPSFTLHTTAQTWARETLGVYSCLLNEREVYIEEWLGGGGGDSVSFGCSAVSS